MIALDSLKMVARLALRNVLRQRARTAVTVAAIAFGVAGLMLSGGFIADLFYQLREATIHSQTGHIQLARRGYFDQGSRSPDEHLIESPAALTTALRRDARVADAMQRLNFTGLLNNGRTDLPVIGQGIEPAREARLGSFLVIAKGRALEDRDQWGAMLGRSLATALNVVPGDRVTLIATTTDGAMNTQEFEIVGLFDSYSRDYDARAVRIHIDAARELLGSNSANTLVVALTDTVHTEAVAQSLRSQFGDRLDLRTWNQLSDFYEKTVLMYDRQFGVLRLIVLFMVLLGVTNSINLSLFERVGEFATMRALGNRATDLYRLLAAEAIFLALLGAAVGLFVGVTVSLAVSWIGIPMPPPPNSELGYLARIQLTPEIVAGAVAVGLVATIVAFVPGAIRAARVPVIDGLRQSI